METYNVNARVFIEIAAENEEDAIRKWEDIRTYGLESSDSKSEPPDSRSAVWITVNEEDGWSIEDEKANCIFAMTAGPIRRR